MKSQQQLIDEGLFIENDTVNLRGIADFYSEQLVKFNKIGIGKKTDNGVKITERLIKVTEKRLNHLRPWKKN